MKLKKIVVTIFLMIFLLIISYFVGTGFTKRSDVVITNYAVSLAGDELTMNVMVSSSAGYIRGFKEHDLSAQQKVLTFYSTFGGINSLLGAKNTFTLSLSPETTEIYFYAPENSVKLVLIKDEITNKWIYPNQKTNSVADSHKIENPDWGISLEVDDVTPTGLYIICTQSGGTQTGELHTGSYYILEKWSETYGWLEADWIPQKYPVAWTEEAWGIPKEDTVVWYIDWESAHGKLTEGHYRIGKEITDFRETGDYDKAMYYAEFEIEQLGETKESFVFQTADISKIIFKIGPAEEFEVSDEDMDDIIKWLSTFKAGEKVKSKEIEPGSNSISVRIEYLDGSFVENGLSTIMIDNKEYYLESADAPDAYLRLYNHVGD